MFFFFFVKLSRLKEYDLSIYQISTMFIFCIVSLYSLPNLYAISNGNHMTLQENIRRCVCIIYDPSKSNQGVLALKALKLSDSFMELYRSNNFTGEKYAIFLG